MDSRDKHLNRHMKQRRAIAAGLPLTAQRRWAQRCMTTAAIQHRTAFYMMANLWLANTLK